MCEAQMTEFIFSHLCWHQRHLRVVNMTVLNPGGISLKQTCAWWRCAIYILSIVSWTNLLFVSRVNYCTIACPYFQPLYNTYNLFSIDSHTRRENSLSLSSIMHYCWICAMKYPYCLERGSHHHGFASMHRCYAPMVLGGPWKQTQSRMCYLITNRLSNSKYLAE